MIIERNIYNLKEILKGCEKLDVCFSRGQSLITENFVEKKSVKKMISLYYSTNLDKIIRTEFVASSKVKIFQKNCVKKLVNDKCWISKRIDNALLIYGGPKFSVAHLLKWLVLGLEKALKNLVWRFFFVLFFLHFCIFGWIGDMTWNYKLVFLLVRERKC